ncbi:MAG: VWA domain-containing protein [Patescibacteria group bacterium]
MKKILIGLVVFFLTVISIPLFSAIENNFINVFAHIENSLTVSTGHIDFGNVFPQQYRESFFSIDLSETFLNTSSVVGVDYVIKQKPKPRPQSYGEGGRFADRFEAHKYCLDNQGDDPLGANYQADYYDYCYRSLCPFLSKLPHGQPEAGDVGSPSYFKDDHCETPNPAEANGSLSKAENDQSDSWTVDLKVPPIEGYVGQDWPSGCPVVEAGDMDFGCDLWVEITNITGQLTYCGDGIKQTPNDNNELEQCDGIDGVGPNQSCTSQCTLENLTYCGDGIKQTPNANNELEQCDGSDGVGAHQTCTNQCALEDLTYCSDGIKQTPNDEGTGGPQNNGFEECDGTDGVGNNQACTDQCVLENISCFAQADVMLVLDRSGSINASELATLKSAAHDFVNSLNPSVDGAHLGQASFSTRGRLDLHLTSIKASIDAAIDALVAGGLTNLKEGIFWGAYEMRDSNTTYERPTVPDYMILITDGNPNQPIDITTARAQAITEANSAKAAGVTIYVVGVGTDPDTTSYLKNNIANTIAHYFDAADFTELSAILDQISISCQ